MATDTEIIEVDHGVSDLTLRVSELVNHQEGNAIHNYRGSAENMFKFTTICTGSHCKQGGDFVGEVVPVKYWYIYPVQFEAADGELTSGIRTVLVTADLQAFGFGSGWIATSLLRAIEAYGIGPYDPPIALRITGTKTRKGRVMLSLEPENLDLVE